MVGVVCITKYKTKKKKNSLLIHCISNSFKNLLPFRIMWREVCMAGDGHMCIVYAYNVMNMYARVSSLAFIRHISDIFLSLKLKRKRYEMVFIDDRNPNYAATRN